MSELLVYVHAARAESMRTRLANACAATGMTARMEVFGSSGSLFQRLRARRSPPPPDLVLWYGPCAAQAAALSGLLEPYQPPTLPAGAVHDSEWRWLATDLQAISVLPSATDTTGLEGAARLAIADPERSESGLLIVLALLDRFRQVDGDVEQGWSWWERRVRTGLALVEDDATALVLQRDGDVSYALALLPTGGQAIDLPSVPHALSIARTSPNAQLAHQIVDWLVSQPSPGTSTSAPAFDVEWATREYTAARQRWAASGWGPTPAPS